MLVEMKKQIKKRRMPKVKMARAGGQQTQTMRKQMKKRTRKIMEKKRKRKQARKIQTLKATWKTAGEGFGKKEACREKGKNMR